MQGYDKFFKQARKASQSDRPTAKPSVKTKSPKFGLASQRAPATAEQRLKNELQRRLQLQKSGQSARRKSPFPIGALLFVIAGLVITGTGMIFPASVEWVQEHVEIGVFGDAKAEGASSSAEKAAASSGDKPAEQGSKEGDAGAGHESAAAAGAEEKSAGPGGESAEKSAGKGKTSKTSTMPDTKSWTAEEVSFFDKLGERKRELDMRESELSRLDEELQKQKVELDEKIKQLESMRAKIAQTLKARVETDQEKVGKLVDVYAGMKPQQAAKILETVNEDLAVQVLDRMKKKNASDILNVMDAKKAQKLSEMLAGYLHP